MEGDDGRSRSVHARFDMETRFVQVREDVQVGVMRAGGVMQAIDDVQVRCVHPEEFVQARDVHA